MKEPENYITIVMIWSVSFLGSSHTTSEDQQCKNIGLYHKIENIPSSLQEAHQDSNGNWILEMFQLTCIENSKKIIKNVDCVKLFSFQTNYMNWKAKLTPNHLKLKRSLLNQDLTNKKLGNLKTLTKKSKVNQIMFFNKIIT